MATINKIKVGNTEYDIEASAIGNLSSITVESSQNTQTPEITIRSNSTGEKAAGNDADIRFECASNKSVAVDGKVSGVVGLNTKGNLSVEALSKHLNLESAKGIQLKPTTNIIFDTSRRIEAQGSDKGNETVVETKWDDYEVPSGQEYKQYGYLKLHARAIDLRTFWHGGIALQPSGIDSDGHENKIKFESSRKVSANTVIPSTLRKEDQNYGNYYNIEGGKGVEFATFNNEHTSIFSKDYRFNTDALVYASKRGDIETDGSKSDYPTQGDDFKDIPIDDDGYNGTYNAATGKWELTPNKGKYLVAATWNSIVKTAHALNDQPWTSTNVSGKGNLQITALDEVEWVPAEDNGHAIVLKNGKDEPKRKYVGDNNVYKLNNGTFAVCELVSEHHLNLESDSTIKLESGFNDIEITAGDKVQVVAPVIQLETPGKVDFSTSPEVSFMARKINKYGGYESAKAKLTITSLNNLGKTVYENVGEETVRITYDTLYDQTGNVFAPELISASKIDVFSDAEHTTPAPDGNYFFCNGTITFFLSVEAGEAGKKGKVCNQDVTNLYTDSEATTTFTLDPTADYTSNAPTLYTAASTAATQGYYITEVSRTKYIIYTNASGVLSQFGVNNNGGTSGKDLVLGWCLLLSDQLSKYDYTGIVFGGLDEAGSGETAVSSGSQLTVGNLSCNINDIVTLVNYFRDGAGKPNGPWAGL